MGALARIMAAVVLLTIAGFCAFLALAAREAPPDTCFLDSLRRDWVCVSRGVGALVAWRRRRTATAG
jgi:hypothetical protein